MADERFFDRLGPLTVKEIAALTGAAISDSGDGQMQIQTVAALDALAPGALGYVENAKIIHAAGDVRLDGIAIIAPPDLRGELEQRGAVVLAHEAPRSAFSAAAAGFFRLREHDGTQAHHPDARIHEAARIGPNVVIGQGAEIGPDVVLDANAVIGPGCRIGAGSRIGANASLRCTDTGENCNILAGAVIGEAGFGVAVSTAGVIDVPHLGSVELGDEVTVGANSTIDRGVFGATRLGRGCKLDNICHVAHNVQAGENVLMPAFAGVSGSTRIGHNVMFGGRVGVADHLVIGDNAKLAANAAVMGDVPEGEMYSGAPAQPIRRHMREIAEIRRLVKSKDKSRKG